LPDIGDVIKGLRIDFSSTYVEMECGSRKFRYDIGAFEPESIEEVTIRRDDDGGIFVGDDLNEFGCL
jgi:hypothetical protein